jgi:hypothetical protein
MARRLQRASFRLSAYDLSPLPKVLSTAFGSEHGRRGKPWP